MKDKWTVRIEYLQEYIKIIKAFRYNDDTLLAFEKTSMANRLQGFLCECVEELIDNIINEICESDECYNLELKEIKKETNLFMEEFINKK